MAGPSNEPLKHPDPSATLISREEEKLLAQAIEKMPPRDQPYVELCFRQGLSPQDIAGILKMSVNAAYTQKSRILNKLREILEKPGSL